MSARRDTSPRTAVSQRAAKSRRSVPGSCSDSTCTCTMVRRAVTSRRIDAIRVSSADVGGDGRRPAVAVVIVSAAVAEPACLRRRRPGTSQAGTARTPGRTRWCPRESATTVCPARSRAGDRPRRRQADRRRFARSIGMTFIRRASYPRPGQLISSALATKDPGMHGADGEDVHPRHVTTDHQHATAGCESARRTR